MSNDLRRIAVPALACIAFAAWWGLDLGSETAPLAMDSGTRESGATNADEMGRAPGEAGEIRDLRGLRSALQSAGALSQPSGPLQHFEFDLRAFGPGGIECPIEPGFLSLELEHDGQGGGTPRTLEFEGHRIPLMLPLGTVIHVLDVQLGPWSARPRTASVEFLGQPKVRLEVDLALGARIEVVDAATQSSIPEVWMRTAEGFESVSTPTPPGFAYPVPTADQLPSPVFLPERHLPWQAWVGAPGYRWQRLQLGVGQDPRRIELEAGCSLEVRLDGMEANAGRHHLRIEGLGEDTGVGRFASRSLKATADKVLEGLPPGRCRVAIDLERLVLPDLRLVFEDIELLGGAHNRVELDLGGLYAASHWAQVQGLVRIPSDLPPSSITIVTERLGEDGHPAGTPIDLQRTRVSELPALVPGELFEWRALGVPLGTYRIRFEPQGHEEIVTLEVPGSQDLSLTLPNPLPRRFWLVEHSGGHPVHPLHVLWRGVHRDGSVSEWRSIDGQDSEGGWPLRCLHTEVDLLYAFAEDPPRTQRVALPEGVTDVEVAVENAELVVAGR